MVWRFSGSFTKKHVFVWWFFLIQKFLVFLPMISDGFLVSSLVFTVVFSCFVVAAQESPKWEWDMLSMTSRHDPRDQRFQKAIWCHLWQTTFVNWAPKTTKQLNCSFLNRLAFEKHLKGIRMWVVAAIALCSSHKPTYTPCEENTHTHIDLTLLLYRDVLQLFSHQIHTGCHHQKSSLSPGPLFLRRSGETGQTGRLWTFFVLATAQAERDQRQLHSWKHVHPKDGSNLDIWQSVSKAKPFLTKKSILLPNNAAWTENGASRMHLKTFKKIVLITVGKLRRTIYQLSSWTLKAKGITNKKTIHLRARTAEHILNDHWSLGKSWKTYLIFHWDPLGPVSTHRTAKGAMNMDQRSLAWWLDDHCFKGN